MTFGNFGPKSGAQLPNTVWAIGGGKGGIGKSFISSSLAICLTRLGKSVTLVDLDLGGANLHTCLGVKIPQATLSDFVKGRTNDINQVAVQTEIQNLNFVSGFNDSLDIADMTRDARERLIAGFRSLPTPYVILDLGAGTSENMIDFFLGADQKIVALTPEPTSIENAYRFMKSAYYRQLRQAEAELGISHLIEAAMDSRNLNGIKSPADLMAYLYEHNPDVGAKLESRVQGLTMQLLLNQVRTRQDIDLGHSMKTICRKYFGIETNYLGYVDHDNAVWQSLRKRRPMIVEFPYSAIVGQFLGVTKNLLSPHSLRAVI